MADWEEATSGFDTIWADYSEMVDAAIGVRSALRSRAPPQGTRLSKQSLSKRIREAVAPAASGPRRSTRQPSKPKSALHVWERAPRLGARTRALLREDRPSALVETVRPPELALIMTTPDPETIPARSLPQGVPKPRASDASASGNRRRVPTAAASTGAPEGLSFPSRPMRPGLVPAEGMHHSHPPLAPGMRSSVTRLHRGLPANAPDLAARQHKPKGRAVPGAATSSPPASRPPRASASAAGPSRGLAAEAASAAAELAGLLASASAALASAAAAAAGTGSRRRSRRRRRAALRTPSPPVRDPQPLGTPTDSPASVATAPTDNDVLAALTAELLARRPAQVSRPAQRLAVVPVASRGAAVSAVTALSVARDTRRLCVSTDAAVASLDVRQQAAEQAAAEGFRRLAAAIERLSMRQVPVAPAPPAPAPVVIPANDGKTIRRIDAMEATVLAALRKAERRPASALRVTASLSVGSSSESDAEDRPASPEPAWMAAYKGSPPSPGSHGAFRLEEEFDLGSALDGSASFGVPAAAPAPAKPAPAKPATRPATPRLCDMDDEGDAYLAVARAAAKLAAGFAAEASAQGQPRADREQEGLSPRSAATSRLSVTTASSWTLPSLGPNDGSVGSGDLSALGLKPPLRGAVAEMQGADLDALADELEAKGKELARLRAVSLAADRRQRAEEEASACSTSCSTSDSGGTTTESSIAGQQWPPAGPRSARRQQRRWPSFGGEALRQRGRQGAPASTTRRPAVSQVSTDPIAGGLLALNGPGLVAPPPRSSEALDQALLDADVALAGVSTDGEDGSSVRFAAR